MIDGIPATTPDGQRQGSSISLPFTERIKVLRGPLALMYGNSSSGVIQAFTQDAPEVPELGVECYASSYGMHRNDVQYAGRVGGVGGVGLVTDYSTFDTNGYRDNSKIERKQFNGHRHSKAARQAQALQPAPPRAYAAVPHCCRALRDLA